jgi:hypothetical protein
MKLAISLLAFVVVASPAWAQSDKSANTETRDTRPEPPMLGKHLAKGLYKPAPPTSVGKKVQLLSYHGGPVVVASPEIRPIFWGTKWATDSAFVGDKITGLNQFYADVTGSAYLTSNTEYTDGSAAHVSGTVTAFPGATDGSKAPSGAPATSAILAEVCKVIGTNVKTNGYYPVYVDTPRGNAGYCAWHSWGSCGSTNVQFAFFFNLDGDPGCDPQDGQTGHSQGLAALANVSGHELSEFLTDPRGNAWFDRSGAENSDKCAWTFGAPFLTFLSASHNSSVWKIQGNWSNAAYNANQGYVDGSKVRGCIDGENP